MNRDSHNFDSLRRLLALKRHEQPPPGYFNGFSRDVMARIKAGESGEKLGRELPWVRRLLVMFEVKPVFAGAFGMAVCALLVSGVISTEHGVATVAPGADQNNLVVDTSPAVPGDLLSVTSGSTNPVASLFDQYQPPIQSQPASYWIPNRN